MLFKDWKNSKNGAFGGSLLKGNPKEARPIVTRRAMHLVLRSRLATGSRSFLLNARGVENLIRKQATRFGVVVYDLANVGNHIHLIVKVQERKDLGRFLRSVTGLLARKTLRAERGSPWRTVSKPTAETSHTSKRRPFWDTRPFSRVIDGDFFQMKQYLLMNRLEAEGYSRLDTNAIVRGRRTLKTKKPNRGG